MEPKNQRPTVPEPTIPEPQIVAPTEPRPLIETPVPATPVPSAPSFKKSKKKHLRGMLKGLSGTIALLIAAPLLAIVITSHVFHSYEVDGSSMESFLQNGDRLIVYKFGKTIANVRGNTYLPNRYDIIVLDRPIQISAPSSVEHLIKRVIALPGERITIVNNVVTVYNKEFPNGFLVDKDQEYAKDIDRTPNDVDITVGQGEVFVLGDNRTNSTDSRVFGSISTDTIVGDAVIRFVPVNQMRRL